MRTIIAKIIDQLRVRHVVLVALSSSLLFSFVIYPTIAEPLNVTLDPDQYGDLGYGLLRHGSLSYYPDPEATVNRGPLYPAFIATVLALTNEWYPTGIQLGQSVLFVITCTLLYWIGSRLFNRRVAISSAMICAAYPFLIWYTSRIWVEVMSTLMVTSVVAALTWLWLRPSMLRGIVLGCVVGCASLVKAIYLPLLLVIPVALWYSRHPLLKPRYLLAMIFITVLTVGPWTIRNWNLTNRFIPVHLLLGYNLERGDNFVENYWKAPLSYRRLWEFGLESLHAHDQSIPATLPRTHREAILDSILVTHHTGRYFADPIFLCKKIALNAWMFWTLGDSPLKSAVIMAMQLPIVILFGLGMWNASRRERFRRIHLAILVTIFVYYLVHLPIMAIARFSVVLVPTMLLYAVDYVMCRYLHGEPSSAAHLQDSGS